jgi:hypothetical protein
MVKKMASSGKSRADENKAIRKQALREQLSNGKHVEHVIDIANKLSDFNATLESTDIQRYKAAADIKLKLINKYLPDTKSIELSSDSDNPLTISVIERTIVKAKD